MQLCAPVEKQYATHRQATLAEGFGVPGPQAIAKGGSFLTTVLFFNVT